MSVTARAFFYVQQVELLVRRRVDEALAPESITAGQYMVLNLIVHHEPVSSAALARQANMTAQSMGEFIKTLEVRGWVTRSTDPSNRRVIRIGSTRGVEVIDRITQGTACWCAAKAASTAWSANSLSA